VGLPGWVLDEMGLGDQLSATTSRMECGSQSHVLLADVRPLTEVLTLTDLMHEGTVDDRDVADSAAHGLFLELPPRSWNIFEIS
jgi:hypothetical protein